MRILIATAMFAGLVAVPFGAGAGPLEGTTIDGIRCDTAEGTLFHVHQHLAIFNHGRKISIPSDVGRPVVAACYYWLHTHTSDGILHVESPVYRDFTLGNFFDIWQQPLTRAQVATAKIRGNDERIWLDGSRFTGDPRSIELTEHSDITIEVGPPYYTPAPFTAWHGQ